MGSVNGDDHQTKLVVCADNSEEIILRYGDIIDINNPRPALYKDLY